MGWAGGGRPPGAPGREGGPRGGRRGGEAGVYVPGENGAAQRVPVTIGLTGDNEVEVVAGLEPGQAVIVGRTEGSGSRRMRSPFGF